MQKEAKARIKINKLLEQSGWRFFDDEKGKANIVLENNIKITKKNLDEFGNDFEKTENGFTDFHLLDEKSFPFVIVEAKSEDKNPLDGKEQARKYAQSQNVRFVILSNGNLHYFWDLERGNPSVITKFPTLESLHHTGSFQPNPSTLVREIVGEDYIARIQNPLYDKDPRWSNDKTRADYINESGLKFLRPYQLDAVHALQESVEDGNDRFLFEMATGTGKTLISAAVIKLFLRSGNAKRVLFLVDRLELEDQAMKNFVRYLKNDYRVVIYKENKDDWRKAEIVVSTVQSLSFDNKYQRLFSPTDFDLLISDEAHRSIGWNSRAVFEYFVGYKLGLTATPKDYLKYLDPEKVSKKDPREWERRQLRDTYITFGCERGTPTYRYSLIDAVRDGYLVNPVAVDARTEITTELLSEKGYSVMIENEEGVKEEQIYYHKDFEKKFLSEETNRILCKTFIENALRDPISGEIGKTIVFCVSQNHASKITQVLNELADRLYPGNYNSDFALQVTSNVQDSQQFTINFTDTSNNLSGHSRFLDGYKTSKTRVCVTVGMMTTGYDCQDILNICLMRPIFSPTDFIQIKGRGTRKYDFTYSMKDGIDNEVIKRVKDKFKLFDFFANCEYFEEKYNYNEILKLPPRTTYTGSGGGEYNAIGEYENLNSDPLISFSEYAVGMEGMKIDRMFFDKFETAIKNNPFIKENIEKENFDAIEEYIKSKVFEKPEDYFNLEKLRKSLRIDRRLSLREMIEKIFGKISAFKTKEDLLEEEVERFISIHKPESREVPLIRNFIKAYITDNEVRDIIESKEFGRFSTNTQISMEDFKELKKWREMIPEYVKDYVSLNKFM
ncbi:MAG: DEAD/DEAH box helicase family protein [Candidatus Methanoperedens sp.]|jgi:type I restriction enzyme R subunit|nr:DEAD/DEAH box helicase family protein [Candidatus Methanoperedens sp.]